MALGQNIAKARALRNMNLMTLARLAGVDYQSLAILEKRDSRSSASVSAIAAALGISTDDLLEGRIGIQQQSASPAAPEAPKPPTRKTIAYAPGPDNPFPNADGAMLDEINELAFRLPVTRKAKLLELARRELADFLGEQATDGHGAHSKS